ncbi:P-loop containing nucleoside triphosphate hydrolase protein [Macroventuria anomochaeta]|uniref:P-loop containing nucleoside triphosphate hydrolase protein n=1 Tax=Macroventuria anomochaeta TaxID=301207 RepID=A0ACB6RL04_9PLEO|nr:P-loop containing nucleoside triphosphate hydrolase protein [Macroventuria anomochaeta]KAF2621652.1 P-loop containing nucleoside triphosphate hydrolase protein [Macroventuria anomochaeta]
MRRELLGTTIELRQAGGLHEVLKTIYKGVDNMTLEEVPPEISPQDLYHASKQLTEHAERLKNPGSEDRTTYDQIQLALRVVQNEFAREGPTIETLLAKGEITWTLLWALFPRNELIVDKDELKQTRAYFARYHDTFKDDQGDMVFGRDVCFVDDNGEKMGFVRKGYLALHIKEFPGSQKIIELPFYPLRYVTDCQGTRSELLKRGRKRMQDGASRLHDCSGHGVQTKHNLNGARYLEPFQCEGHVVVDHATFGQLCPEDELIPYIYRAIDKEVISDEQIMTMPAILYGFHLGKKVWGGFLVKDIAPIQWHPEIFAQLVLPQSKKELIGLLVREHSSKSDTFDDFVENKGRGLIGLLCGPPGVGKTLTVEAIAEIAQRPLYTINSGELGVDADTLDEKLERILQIAEVWEAIVLLDEADVFLVERSKDDLHRNAVVSVFLRRLEYYRGILLLTTNRADAMDAAFESRIHFRIAYPDLDANARLVIWKAHLARLSTSASVTLCVTEDEYAKLAAMAHNGRQIKNAVRLLSLLVSKRKEAVRLEHIEAAIM